MDGDRADARGQTRRSSIDDRGGTLASWHGRYTLVVSVRDAANRDLLSAVYRHPRHGGEETGIRSGAGA